MAVPHQGRMYLEDGEVKSIRELRDEDLHRGPNGIMISGNVADPGAARRGPPAHVARKLQAHVQIPDAGNFGR